MTYRYPTQYLVKPIVNLNGTSREALVEQQNDVVRAADALVTAMRAAMPHPRDFQTTAPGTYEAARDAYAARLELVLRVHAEIDQFAYDIAQEGR